MTINLNKRSVILVQWGVLLLLFGAQLIVSRTPGQTMKKKNIECTLYLLETTGEAGSYNLPAELQTAIKQMEKTLAYKGYRLLNTLVLPVIDGRMIKESGQLSIKPPDPSIGKVIDGVYKVSFISHLTSDDKGKIVEIDKFSFSLIIPTGNPQGDTPRFVDFPAKVSLREKQTVVFGKVGGVDGNLIVVFSARVLD